MATGQPEIRQDMKKAQRDKLMKQIVADTNSPTGYSLVDPAVVKELVDAGLIEVNTQITSPDGKIAARATAQATAPVVAEPAPVFALVDGIPLAPAKRGGKKGEEYPFSQMAVGQSFFVPATEKYPKPWETFASTVSSATRRFSEKSPTLTRVDKKGATVPVLVATKKFTLRQVQAGQTYDNGYTEAATGARVFRTA